MSKKEGGRPTAYDPKYCDMIIEYFSVKPYEEDKNGKIRASDPPTMAGFACKIGVHRETLLNWQAEHEEFFDAYKRSKELQENWFVINGNRGLIAQPFAIFTAKNVLGWKDKKEVDVTGRVESVSDDELDKRIKQLEEKSK